MSSLHHNRFAPTGASTLASGRSRQPRVAIHAENRSYLLKTVTDHDEFLGAARLRHQVFHQEMRGSPVAAGFDTDAFDDSADILIIVEKTNYEIVGTYRLLCSHFTDRFYSEGEFGIAQVLDEPGVKLELSRACVKREFRSGAVIQLLWRGIYQYLAATGASRLFGCSSMQVASLREIAEFQRLVISQDKVITEHDIFPRPEYYADGDLQRGAGMPFPGAPGAHAEGQLSVPALLQTYLKAGARVALIPAWDQYFGCYDFFTLLNTREIHPAFVRAFGA